MKGAGRARARYQDRGSGALYAHLGAEAPDSKAWASCALGGAQTAREKPLRRP